MRRFVRGEAFDEQPMPDLTADEVDLDAVASAFEDVRTLRRADLDTLRLMVRHQGRAVPTVGGVLLFGRDRLAHFPDAWVQVGRFAGTDRSRIVDQAEIVSHPSEAVREALVNALVHADYAQRGAPLRVALFDDRLEIESLQTLPYDQRSCRPLPALIQKTCRR